MGETIVRVLSVLLKFRTDASSERDANESIAKFARNAMQQLRNIGEVAAAIAFDKVVQNLLKAGSQAEDVAFKFENIYGNLSDAQAAWAEDFANTYNRSATKVKESLTQIQQEMLGFTRASTDAQKQNVSEMSRTIEQAGLNLGAFYGMDSRTAINTLMSAVQGSESALTQLRVGAGGTVTQSRQNAMRQLVDEGSIRDVRSYDRLTNYEKSLVNLRAVLLANKDATDALARSQENYSTLHENFSESLEELRESLGEFFLPTAKKVVDFLTVIVRMGTEVLDGIKSVTDALGITEPLITSIAELFAVIIGMKLATVIGGIVTSFRNLYASLGATNGALSGLSSTAAGTIGIITAMAVVLYDLTNFLNGKESTTGKILEKLGIDAEKAIPFVEGLRAVIIALTVAFIALKVASIATGTALMATPIGWIVAAIAVLIAAIVLVVKHWDSIREKVISVFASIKNTISNVIEWIKAHILDIGLVILGGPVGAIVVLIRHFEELKDVAEKVWNSIKKFFGVGDYKKSGKDMAQMMADGIEEGKSEVENSAEEVAEVVSDNLQFHSPPKKGPLSHFDESMPEMIQLIVGGIKNGLSALREASNEAAGVLGEGFSQIGFAGYGSGMRLMAGVSDASLAMAGGIYNTSNSSRSVTQNITFNQEFNGPETQEQKFARAAERSSEDMTGVLARLLSVS